MLLGGFCGTAELNGFNSDRMASSPKHLLSGHSQVNLTTLDLNILGQKATDESQATSSIRNEELLIGLERMNI